MKKRSILKFKSGISILEVVIVLVIVIVIGVVLAPVFLRSRESPGRSPGGICSNNLHECAIALQTYWTDYDNTLPSSAIVRHSKTWNKNDFARFATRLGHVPVPTGQSPSTWPQALYSHMRSRDRFFCPSDPTSHDNSRSRVSYYWKTAIDRAWYGVGCKKPCRTEADFAYNADQIVFYERAGFHDGHAEGLKNEYRINVAYLDTHVRNVTLTNCAKGLITDPTSLGEPMYFNFDNTKSRGMTNPPPADVPANHTDPSRYSDMLP